MLRCNKNFGLVRLNNKICCSSLFAISKKTTTSFGAVAFSSTSVRFCSSSTYKNPVDVENWTLDEEIVKRHQQVQQKWVDLAQSFRDLKEENNHQGVLEKVEEGFKLLQEVGAENSPVQCSQMLLMTKAQAHFNLKQFDQAFENAQKARQEYHMSNNSNNNNNSTTTAALDEGSIRDTTQFLGFVELERGNYQQALDIFDGLLVWVNEDSRKALPMVQVLAVNMKRTIQTGKARALYGLATSSSSSVDSKALLNESLDLLIDSLSAHVDEKDVEFAKSALDNAILCYCALGDYSKAEDACDKLQGWCKRHDDEQGLELAESRRKEIEGLKK